MAAKVLISLVIPCRNEAERLPGTLAALRGYLDGFEGGWEVVVVDERSEDGTAALAREFGGSDGRWRVLANPVARGKGYAVKTGMLAAQGDCVFFMDADMSVPVRFVGEFLPVFEAGADVVIGSRRHPESRIVRSQPLMRVLCGRAFNLGLRAAGVTRLHDTQCGFKAFRREAAREVFSRVTLDGFGFDVEAIALAEAMGLRVVERPVEWSDAEGTKVKALRDGVSSFVEALGAARRARRGVARR